MVSKDPFMGKLRSRFPRNRAMMNSKEPTLEDGWHTVVPALVNITPFSQRVSLYYDGNEDL